MLIDNIILLILIGSMLIVIIISYIYSSYCKINDYYRVGALFTAAAYIIDTFSDVLFAVNISHGNEYGQILFVLFVLSIVFIVVPVILSVYQLYKAINEWQRIDILKEWISDNVTILYFLSILTVGSFGAIELCTSNLFNLSQFDMPLSKHQLRQYKTRRLYSTILLEV